MKRVDRQRRGAPGGAPIPLPFASSGRCPSGEHWLAILNQQVLVSCLYGKRVILFLEPSKLGFQVPYSLLEAAHLGNHAGVGTADVAE